MLFDVFTDRPFSGNQLAIFPQAVLGDETMQRIARELNLSETVFVEPLAGESDAGVVAALRIFTPSREVAFAGHPTIGTAIALVDHLWWIGPNESTFTLREPAGDIAISIDRGNPTLAWLTMPPVALGRKIAREEAAAMLGLDPGELRDDLPAQLAGAGNPFLLVPLRSREAVDRALLNERATRAAVGWDEVNGIYVFSQSPTGAYARMFAPMSGIVEDPATGSAAGSLYAYLTAHAALEARERFVNEQGVAMGRPSLLHLRLHWAGARPERIEVGGSAVYVGEGVLRACKADRVKPP
jgi:trans-2,3-dihydro-3-hydroxyanthranilate isomerase